MKNKDSIKDLLEYLQTTEDKELQFDEETIAAYQKNNDNQSLAIKILSVFGGLLASIAFSGFLVVAGLQNSELGLLILGTLCISGAIWINKKYDKLIIDTLSISSFIIGFIILLSGFDKLHLSENTISIIFIVIALSSMFIVQNYILSFVSALIINGCILALIISNKGYDLIHVYVSALALIITYVYLKEAKIIMISKALSKLYNPIRIGLIFSFLSGLTILGNKGMLPVSPDFIWVSSVIIISATIYLLSHIFEILDICKNQQKMSIYVFSTLILLSTALSPAISGAILIILLSFLVNHKTGLVIGVIAFIYFISQFYYDLNFTLLIKSILLFSSGVLFIVLYLFTHKKMTSNEKI